MTPRQLNLKVARTLVLILGSAWLLAVVGCAAFQRKLLYYPGHSGESHGLTPWIEKGRIIGYSRKVLEPHAVWLMCHGNGGQASDRAYALRRFSDSDTVYILEYPGYGLRDGTPSKASFDEAAAQAYLLLRRTYPGLPVCVISESIGSGPACMLVSQPVPPDKLVLVVPFDRLSDVASEHFPFLPVSLLLLDRWDNVGALKGYKGPVEIYGAANDQVIPYRHAKALADSLPQAQWHLIEGGHNDWSMQPFTIRYP